MDLDIKLIRIMFSINWLKDILMSDTQVN